YIREPNLRPEELLQFDGIDTFRLKNAVNLSIQHKLQTKRKDENGQRKTVDLLSFIVSSEYTIKDDFGTDEKLEDIEYNLEIQPYDWMYIDADARLDRENKVFDIFNADLHVEKSEDFRFGAGYRYEKHENSQITGYAAYHINRENWKKHWTFEIYERYEIQEKQFQEQEYTIIKDLHCWTGEATLRVKNQNDYTFWLIFKLKAFPDMPFFFRTAYRGPEPGNKRQIY
ncbi:MAG: hypothetical protein U9R52_02845, partial [Candidatus Omnitrophota bacterium]|nr:hypothetical protein [Candidatus Omnitrophota bacterium]